jgi:hypothetical protein
MPRGIVRKGAPMHPGVFAAKEPERPGVIMGLAGTA